MKIEIAKITGEETKFEEIIPASDWTLDRFDVKFIDNIHVTGTARKEGIYLFAHAEVVMHQEVVCARCSETFKQTLKQKCRFEYNIRSLKDFVEIDNDVREEILLNFPMRFLCKADCKGICRGCGVNLNSETCKC